MLEKIEEALKYYLDNFHQTKESGRISFDACQALASLRAMLEGDVGEDVKLLENYFDEPNSAFRERLALKRVAAKAKIGEVQIREAKREMLEKFRAALQVEPDIFDFIDRELAALGWENGK